LAHASASISPIKTYVAREYKSQIVISWYVLQVQGVNSVGCLTLINLKGTQVFQVQLPSGDWVDVEPNPGKLIVSIGEVLSYWTSQRYKTAKLQVINPKSTICIPFCFEPNYDAVIVPLHQHSHNQSFKALIYKEN